MGGTRTPSSCLHLSQPPALGLAFLLTFPPQLPKHPGGLYPNLPIGACPSQRPGPDSLRPNHRQAPHSMETGGKDWVFGAVTPLTSP